MQVASVHHEYGQLTLVTAGLLFSVVMPTGCFDSYSLLICSHQVINLIITTMLRGVYVACCSYRWLCGERKGRDGKGRKGKGSRKERQEGKRQSKLPPPTFRLWLKACIVLHGNPSHAT